MSRMPSLAARLAAQRPADMLPPLAGRRSLVQSVAASIIGLLGTPLVARRLEFVASLRVARRASLASSGFVSTVRRTVGSSPPFARGASEIGARRHAVSRG